MRALWIVAVVLAVAGCGKGRGEQPAGKQPPAKQPAQQQAAPQAKADIEKAKKTAMDALQKGIQFLINGQNKEKGFFLSLIHI